MVTGSVPGRRTCGCAPKLREALNTVLKLFLSRMRHQIISPEADRDGLPQVAIEHIDAVPGDAGPRYVVTSRRMKGRNFCGGSLRVGRLWCNSELIRQSS